MDTAGKAQIILGILLSALVYPAAGQWVQTNGPCGGSFESVVVKDSVLYTSVYGKGVFRSTDQGTSWTAINDGLTKRDIYSLAFTGDNLFAGTEFNGILIYSENDGSWTQFESKTGNSYERIFNLTARDDEVWVPTKDGLVKIFENDGEWVDTMIYPLYASNDVVFTENHVFLSVRNILARSADDGVTWDTCTSGLPPYASIVSFIMLDDNSGLLCMGDDKGIFITADAGDSWEMLDTELDSRILGFTARNDTILCLYPAKIGMSVDRGATWTDYNTEFTLDSPHEIDLLGNSLFLASSGGIFKSSFTDRKWVDITAGIVSGSVTAMLKVGEMIFAGGEAQGKMYRSDDNGINWKVADSGFEFLSRVHAITYYDSLLLAGCDNQGLLQSTDFGQSWTLHDYSNDFVMSFQEVDGKLLLGNYMEGILSLPTRGSTLTSGFLDENKGLSREIPDCGCAEPYPVIPALTSIDGTAYASIVNYGVFAGTDTDTGMTWVPARTGLTDSIVTALFAANGILFAATMNDGIFRSTDRGSSWSPSETDFSGKSVSAFINYGPAVFAGTEEGVFYSVDSGVTWTRGETEFREPVESFLVDGYHLLAGTATSGVWRRPIPEMVGIKKEQNRFASMQQGLHTSFRRGDAGSVILQFDLSGKEQVTLGIFDLNGKLKAQMVDQSLAPGSYRFSWDTRGVAGGCYIATLRVGGRRWCERVSVF